MSATEAITTVHLPGLEKIASGKVREIFDLGDRLLMVSTDRISAFDYVLPNGIPGKGMVLTQLSRHWFALTGKIVPNHLIECDVARYPRELKGNAAVLEGRSMIVRKAKMFPVECVVRGYLAGSGYKEYLASGATSGVRLPKGLQLASRLPEPIFTPATKAASGHDENISFEAMASIIGGDDARRLRELSLAIFMKASEHAEAAGVIIADTKFEFGRLAASGEILLCDEVLTPDSSRFWDREGYRPGISPPSFDKQFVRDHLEQSGWNQQPPVPKLPPEIVEGTSGRYKEIYRRLTGHTL